MRKREGATEPRHRRHIADQPFDEADWVDWDHWQTVEELQNFMNGLTETSAAAESAFIDSSGEEGQQQDHIARQIHRHGLEVDA